MSLRRRLSSGDLGSLPVVVGLVAIWVVFYLLNERFISSLNVTNLMLQWPVSARSPSAWSSCCCSVRSTWPSRR